MTNFFSTYTFRLRCDLANSCALLMMSVNNNNMDLALALGFSDHTVRTKLNNDSGAGVNAGSGLHIFAAPDPLSELVWTPRKGLSLKCADNSLANKKPFLLWNVAPSNDVSTPPEIIRFDSINDQKDIGKGNLLVTLVISHVSMEFAQTISWVNLLKRVLACLGLVMEMKQAVFSSLTF